MSISPGQIHLIEATDTILLDEHLVSVKAKLRKLGFANPWQRFSAKELKLSTLRGDWQNLSFFGGEVYCVSSAEVLKKADWEEIASFLDISSSHFLIVHGTSIDQRLSAVKQLKSKGCITVLKAPERQDWSRFAATLAKERFALNVSGPLLQLLKDLVGSEPWQVFRALEQIALYLHPGKEVNEAVVVRCLGGVKEEDIFAITKAIANRERKRSLYLLDQVLERGVEALYILAMLKRHYGILLRLATHSPQLAPAERAKAAGCPPYFLKEYETQLKRYTAPELIDIYHSLALIDGRLKSERTPALLIYSEWLLGSIAKN